MVILPSHIARNLKDLFLTKQHNMECNKQRGPLFVAAQMASSPCARRWFLLSWGRFCLLLWSWMRTMIFYLRRPFRPAERSIGYQFDPVLKDVSERSTLFEFGTWVDVTCSKYFHVLQISRIHFNLKEKICGIALPSSSFFIF